MFSIAVFPHSPDKGAMERSILHVKFNKWPCRMSLLLGKWFCPLSVIRKKSCRVSLIIFSSMPPVEFKKPCCHLSHIFPCRLSDLRKSPVVMLNLRNGIVALSILGVNL